MIFNTVGGATQDNILNLLDNSDFTNPVNTSGLNYYTGIGYGIDKWFSSSGYSGVAVNDGYVNIKSTNGTSAAYLLQFVELAKIKNGKKYTAACELKNGSVHCTTATVSTAMTESVKYIYVDGVQLGTIRLKYDAGQAQYAVLFSTTSTSGIDVVNVALYEGEYTDANLPAYQPRGYSVELAVCGGGGLSMELLWENASPRSGFAAQSISLDCSKYQELSVVFSNWAGYEELVVQKIRKGNNNLFSAAASTNTTYKFNTLSREVAFSDSGITFALAVSANYVECKERADVIIPLKIYGIKGVSA